MEEKNSEKKERKMRDSGIPWIGEVPEGWGVHPLYSYFMERKNKNSMLQEQNLLSLSYGKIIRKDINTNGGLLPANFTTYNIVQPNDVVIRPTDLQNDKRSLRTGLVTEKGIITSAYISLQPITDIYVKYFHYLLHSYDVNKVFYNMGNGVRQGLNYSEFSKLMLLCPEKEEQQRIADYLDSKCSEIDALIDNLKTRIEKAKEYKKAVITEAVTKGLDKDAKMKDSGVEWIGEIPEGWKYAKAKYCIEIQNGSDPHLEGNIPVYGSGAKSFKTCGEYKNGPTVLIGRKGATLHIPHYIVGKFWNVDTAFNVYTKPHYLLKYYYYCAVSFDYKSYISQTTLPSMTQTNYENMVLPMPSLLEQQQIVSFLDYKCSEIDTLLQNYEDQISTLEEYKKSLIYEYVTGKKEVPAA